jgi:uncharacterized protein YjbI with pentapeptide repeats
MEASELKEILEQHKFWIETNALKGQRANLKGANLEGACLEGANLEGACLEGACLEGANLTHANLTGANLYGAKLQGADLIGAKLSGAILRGANLSGAILSDISWIIPGCLAQLNEIKHGFFLAKESKWENFVQDSIGFFIQYNLEEKTFDILLGDRIIRNIPDWIKYSGLNQAE